MQTLDRDRRTVNRGRKRPATTAVQARRSFIKAWRLVWANQYSRIAVLAFSILFMGAVVVRMFENYNPPADPSATKNFSTLGNALWWAIVTMLTVGYGDIAPETPMGRLVAGVVMLSGAGVIAVFTATIASLFTERRLREARGLEQVKSKDHIIICGWSPHLEKILDGFVQMKVGEKRETVLINDLPEEQVEQILLKYEELEVKYVKGDFVQEAVLKRANVEVAHSAIILASREKQEKSADERTLMATLAIKNLRPEIKVCAEILDPANEQHLRIADADDIIVTGEHTGFLLASSAVAPGLPYAVRQLLTYNSGSEIWRSEIPRDLVGKSFQNLSEYFRKEHQAILIGVITEEQGIPIKDMLSGGSPIDRFIEQKFRAAGRDLASESRKKADIVLNPPDDYEIQQDDAAVVVAKYPIEP